MEQMSGDYRKIRNTIKFILGNINDYDNSKLEFSMMTKSILNDIKQSFYIIRSNFESYNFLQVTKELMNQLTNGSIQYLLDYYKEIGYIVAKDDSRRRELQYALNEVLKYILYSVGSIIPVTTEEVWKENLAKYLIVAEIEISEGELSSNSVKFVGLKCQRCWNFFKKEDMSGEVCKNICSKFSKPS